MTESDVQDKTDQDKLQDLCITKANYGRQLVGMFVNDVPVLEQKMEVLNRMLQDLLHFHQHVIIRRKCFLECEDLQDLGGATAEESLQRDYDICAGQAYNDLLYMIASKLVRGDNVIPLIEHFRYEIAKEWFEAGLLQSLQMHDPLTGEKFAPNGGTRKIGRNERCPCMSGKKFKKCCGTS